ncbi:MAG TPA: hypothetical protein VGJ81_22085 [Thermoanaerobaculia bacterium]|jgi:hypothetical protein
MQGVKITFTHVVQESQDLGTGDDHMISDVFFDLEYGGRTHRGLHVDVKQVVGGDVERDPLEVGHVIGYSGPGNYILFRGEVERYFRNAFGSRGSAIQVSGSSNVKFRNNTAKQHHVVQFDVTPEGGW